MEGLNPLLNLIWTVKKSLEKGESIRLGLRNFQQNETDEWKNTVLIWFTRLEQGQSVAEIIHSQKSPYRRQVLLILERGLRGESILASLVQLEKETQEKVEADLEAFSAKIPYYLMLPLCLFMFPACLMLILGPFILQLVHSF